MAIRKLTTQEKVKMLGYSPFIDVLEIDAMEEAKKLSENVATEAKLKQHSNNILINGGLQNKTGHAKTWLVYFTADIEVSEKDEDGMQLRQTIDNLLTSGKLRSTTREVLTKQAESVILN